MGSEPGSEPAAAVVDAVCGVADALRARGVPVGIGQVLAAHRALAAVDLGRAGQVRAALRATLCSSHEDLLAFDAALAAARGEEPPARPGPGAVPRVGAAEPPAGEEAEEEQVGGWSAAAALRDKDFAALDAEERALVRAAAERLALRLPVRRSRRLRPAPRRGEVLDLRRTVRELARPELAPPRPRYRRRGTGPRRLVLLCDASRSMTAYSRPLLEFARASVAARRRVEAFVFSTRLTRVTAELRGRDADAALARALEAVQDWDSGTRIGESLATLTHEQGGRLGRGAVVVIFSDGWDRGDPELLRREMERLRRCAHRVVWVNPHAADPEFEPLTRGMVAALGSVDDLRAASTLAGLEDLVDLLATLS